MRKIILMILSIFVTSFLYAINLEDAQKIARQNNKNFLSQKANVEQANWNKYNAFTNFLPKFSLDESIVRIDNDTYNQAIQTIDIPVFDINNPSNIIGFLPMSSSSMYPDGIFKTTYTTKLTIQQPIFNGGKIFLGYQIANLSKKQADLNLQSKGDNLDYQVAEVYFNLLKMNDVLEISEKSLVSSQVQLEKVTEKFDVGIAKKSDILQWKVKVENDKITLEEIKNSIAVLKTVWKNLLGFDTSENIPLPENIFLSEYDIEIKKYSRFSENEKDRELQQILSQTENYNPDLKNLAITEKIAKKGYQIAKGNFLPSLNLQYSRQFESDDKLDFDGITKWNVAAIASFPIFQSGANFTNLKKSKYEFKKTKLQLEDAKEKILMGAENSFYNIITNAKKVNGSKLALENSKENHKIINDFYKQNMVTNTELLDAEVMLFAGEMNLAVAYYDYILAKYELYKFIKK
ncbi:MAG: TolC family protein [Candidatus Cloacimonetes bacterium]|nr:TolC family protein [Candidatus Cloacimonadota bacterium]MBL7086095.1 TolC family protein [Candidatus Cloacimonadota bacterium]